ncbi:MAG TPA: hypothetical protein VFN63_10305 [Pseudolabrys sp.]|nr:hypothetical protein [Pseudolabrys sp.]
MDFLRRIAPGSQLGRGGILECRLLLLDLLSESFDILFDFCLEPVPGALQLAFGVQPHFLASIRLFFGGFLEFIAFFVQVGDQLLGSYSGIGLNFAGFRLERGQYGIHFIDPLFGPVEIEMHAALGGHNYLHLAGL